MGLGIHDIEQWPGHTSAHLSGSDGARYEHFQLRANEAARDQADHEHHEEGRDDAENHR